jgi:prephenate dehydratase
METGTGGPDRVRGVGRYAYLGPEGTFAEAALRTIPEVDGALTVPQRTVPAAIEAVRADQADAAVVPIENSVEGSVATTLDELAAGAPLQIVREILLPVTFSLLVRPGTDAAAVKTVATHPHAEAQTRRWLREHLPAADVVFTGSTAGAAMAVGQGEYDAAVAAPIAGVHAKLEPLAEDIADNPGGVTRFVLLTRPGPPPAPTGRDKTSLVAFIRDDHTGALLEVLTEFAVRGVNLTRIESRPTGELLGRYCFSVDCEGHLADARVGDALAALHRICADVRYLGSYPRAGAAENKPLPPGRDDTAFAAAADWVRSLGGG